MIVFTPSPRPTPSKPTREVAEGAARWWRKQIDGSRLPGRDNGAQNEPGNPMSSALGVVLILSEQMSVPRADTAQLDAFEKELADWIADNTNHRELSCDYDPSQLLAGLAAKHGIDGGRFPWKTHMYVEEVFAEASAGYGAKPVCVAGVKPWNDHFHDDGDRAAGVEHIYAGVASPDGRTWRIHASPSDDCWSFEGEDAARAAFAVVLKALPLFRERAPNDLRGEAYSAWCDERSHRFAAALGEVQR